MDIQIISRNIPRPIVNGIKYGVLSFKRIVHNKKKILTDYQYVSVKTNDVHSFFGYYDVLPFNAKTDEIVFEEYNEKETFAKIVLLDLKTGNKKYLAESRAWNWQQGSRLRWMPNGDRLIIYNDYDGSHYFSKIMNVDTGSCQLIDYPLYDISPDGNYGLSLNFERLGVKRPGYGYTCREYNYSKDNLKKEGIDLIDINRNTAERLFTYSEIAKNLGLKKEDFENNYLNHISFSPSGKLFLFFWLTIEEDGWHDASLMVYNIDTKGIKILEKGKKMSHYVWVDDDTIICTGIDRNKQCRYYKYSISTNQREILVSNVLNRDGHPSYLGNDTILTDTYPDKDGYQNLLMVNLKTGATNKVLSVYNNCLINGEKRTDLHPRYSSRLRMICIDANPNRYRQMIFLKL